MICANCGTQNEPGTRFCDECGAALAAACPSCGATNRANAKFCATCGTTLVGPAPANAEERETVGDQDAVRGAAPQAERRLVSIMFVDLVGFTPYAEERDPEQVRETLDRYFGIARLAIERHGGTIEKFIGDAVMAVWGTPIAHEDDAERAVRACLELVDSVRELGSGIEARGGIMTGEAAVTIGAEGQGMVAGDLVNTASRLQSVAPAGAVLVGEGTMRASEAAINFEPVGGQDLKGKSAPVAAFRATRVVANRGGQSRSESLEAPFVGREEELRELKDLLHAATRDQRVRLITITGPAGIGKSRLTWEFEKYVDGLVETIFWHRGRSPAYGEGVTFWALGEMVRRRAELTEVDDEAKTRARIAACVAQFIEDVEERAWVERALLTLLGVEPAPVGGRDALFAAWRVFFERIAARGTTALVFEDLQWADTGLLDFIEHLLEWSKNLPLIVIALSRPDLFDRRPGWGSGQRFMTAMTLEPLPAEHMRQLLAGLVPGLPQAAVKNILERADGIPLYAVETVRMLVAAGRLELADGVYRPVGELTNLAVPETLRSLIASRLDGLEPADRSLLQDAAVLGQRFTQPALTAVSGIPANDLEPRMRNLVRREFLDVEADPRSPERGQYGFVQGLIREVAYGTLARRDRRSRHLAAARYFEGLGDEELAGALATHYLAAHEASAEGAESDAIAIQARIALRGAAERAAALGAHDQAVAFIEQALAISTDPTERAPLVELAADSANAGAAPELAERYAREAIDIHLAAGDDSDAVRCSALLGRILIDAGRLEDAIAAMEAALSRRGGESDDGVTAVLLATLSRAYMRSDRRVPAIEVADRALTVAERDNLDAVVAEAFNNKGAALSGLGRRREARVLNEAAVALADRLGLTELALRARNNLSVVVFDDDPRLGLQITLDSVELGRRVGQRSIVHWQSGTAAMYMHAIGEDWDGALAHLDETLSEDTPAHDRTRALTIRALILTERDEDARSALDEAIAAAAAHPEPQVTAGIAWARAQAALNENRFDEVAPWSEAVFEVWADFARFTLPIAIRANLTANSRDEFERIAGRLEAIPSSGGFDSASREWVAACRAALDGRTAQAVAGFQAAKDTYRAVGFRLYEGLAIVDALRLLPDQLEVRRWEPDARAIFERLKAGVLLHTLDDAVAASSVQAVGSKSSKLRTSVART